MRKLLALLSIVVLCAFAVPAPASAVSYGSISCPEDGCSLIYAGQDKWCQGVKCRHQALYHCGCCSNYYWVYVD